MPVVITSSHRRGKEEDGNLFPWLLPALFALLLVVVPLVPDVKLSRPKLFVLETGLYGLLFLWLAAGVWRQRLSLRRTPLAVPLAAYTAAIVLFYVASPDRYVSASELKRSLLSLAGFIVAAHAVVTDRQRALVLGALFFGGLLAALYGILQHYGGIGPVSVPHLPRPMSTFGNPIFFAAHLTVVLPLAVAVLFSSRAGSLRLLSLGFLAAGIVAVYFSQTRAAYLGLAAAVLVFFLLKLKAVKLRWAFAVLFAAGFFSFVIATRPVWLRHQAHFLIWRDTALMWLAHPLTGTGLGTFHLYFPRYASDELKQVWPQHQFIVNDAHSEYLQYLSETGMLGFGLFAWVLLSFFVHTLRRSSSAREPSATLLYGTVASASGILVQNIFSVDMRFIISSVYLFIVMGLAETFHHRHAEWKASAGMRPLALAAVLCAAAATFHAVLVPYQAQRKVAATPDFFDEKILEPARTIADLQALAQRYPDQSLVFEKLGWVYAKERRWEEAVASYEKAARLKPDSAGPFNNLGNICFLLGNRSQAIAYWQRSLAVNANQLDARLNLAMAHYHNGQLKEASEELREVLRRSPNNEKAMVMLKEMSE